MKKFKTTLDDKEEYFKFICPRCQNEFRIQAYFPIKVSILRCDKCGFSNEEDERHL